MTAAVAISRFTDIRRIGELHALVTNAFRDLAIDPPSGVLKESVADFLKRLQSETALVAERDAALIGGVFCASKEDSLYVGRLAVRGDVRRLGVASRQGQGNLVDAHHPDKQHRAVRQTRLRGCRRDLPPGISASHVLRHGVAVA
jgi:hypothetical protein